jgi:hypothetical protein
MGGVYHIFDPHLTRFHPQNSAAARPCDGSLCVVVVVTPGEKKKKKKKKRERGCDN